MKNVINRTLAVKKKMFIHKSVSTCLRIASAMRPFRLLPVLVVTLFGVNESAWGQKYVGTTWYSLYDATERTNNSILNIDVPETVVPPTNGKIYVDWKKDKVKAVYIPIYGWTYSYPGFDLSVNNTKIVTSNATVNEGTTYASVEGAVGENITSVTVTYHCSSSEAGHIKNIRIPMKKHIWLQKSDGTGIGSSLTKDFQKVKWEQSKGIKVNFHSFLTSGNITVKIKGDTNNDFSFSNSSHGVHTLTSSDANKTYSVGSNRCASQNAAKTTDYCSSENKLGNAANYDFTVYFYPKRENSGVSYSNNNVYVEISDGTTTAYVYLRGTVDKRNQTIQNFSTTAETHWTSDAIPAFAAYTTDNTSNQANNLTITYTSSNTQIATVAANGAVTIKKGGNNNDTQVTLRATQAGNDWYNSTYKEVTYTINKVTPAVTWPTILTGLKYNETCPINTKVEDKWTGGSAVDNKQNPTLDVDGSFTCGEKLVPAKNTTGYTATFTPDNTNWYNPISEKIYGTVEKGDQTITWNLLAGKNAREQWYEYATGEQFDAVSTSGFPITYSTSNSAFATVDANNKLNVVKANEIVTITASQSGDDNWNAADPVVAKEFKTCGAKPNDWSAVTASNLTYGDLLELSTFSGNVKLNGVVVPGTLAWEDPSILPSATQNNSPESFSVRFTPENENVYGSVVFDVPVTVAKANAELSWHIGHGLRENTNYTNFVTSSNTDPEASLNITVSSPLSVEDNVLTTGSVGETTERTITVSQAATANYNAIAETAWSVTIRPKVNVCLPVSMTESTMGDMTISSEKASWCNTNTQGTDHFLTSDVRYSQTEGIALGTWKDGLDGISWNKIKNLLFGDGTFEWSAKSIDLSFTGVPDRISFSTQLQLVEFLWLGDWKTARVTADQFILYQSADGSNYTQVQTKQGAATFDEALNPTTRYIRIEYKGNFTGFIKNLKITQKKYLTTEQESLTFADDAERPLQDPQELTISYSSLGSCALQSGAISVSSNNPAFYVDETEITDNVGIDQYGTYTVRVRCNDVNQSGKIIFEAYDETRLEVPVSSAKPILTASSPVIFKTGTEHAPATETLYRTLAGIEYTGCFDGAEAKFDTLYIYGVSESAASSRAWEWDASKGYNVPVVAADNLHTPCFVYAKNGSQYDYTRTFNATTISLNIQAAGKKLGFIGYKPAGTAAFNAIQLNGAANEQTEVYLNNAEIAVNGTVLKVSSTEDAEDPFNVNVFARGTNILQANAAAVQLSANKAQLTIEDSWKAGDASALMALRPGTGKPSIDLGGAKGKVIINGSKVELHNGTKMAIAHMDGTTEMTDGEVKINDGTILGDAILGLPHKTIIDGGTFNAGDIKVYKTTEKVVRALNSRNELLGRQTTTEDQLPDWYGKSHLTLDGTVVHPMLFGGEGLCIFDNTTNDNQSATNANWTETPTNESDAIITRDMEITGSLEVKSLTINPDATVIVKENATLSVGDGDSYLENAGNLYVETGGKVVLTTGKLSVNNFYLDAKLGNVNGNQPANSGQVTGETALTINGDAYFDLALDPSGECSPGWYDFTVPFPVDVMTGITRFNRNTGEEYTIRNEVNYAIMDFSENRHVESGYGWKKFRGIMQPGQCYSITIDSYDNIYRFKKTKTGTFNNQTEETLAYTDSEVSYRGWNGLGNGTLKHIDLSTEDNIIEKVQIYNHATNSYTTADMNEFSFVVGSSYFVQAPVANSVISYTAGTKANDYLRAPRRAAAKVNSEFKLTLMSENTDVEADRLYVGASEEALDSYEIGRDLTKFGNPTDSKVAQVWANAYGMKLCDIDMLLTDNAAECTLGLYAPKAGSFWLAIDYAPENATLYLTHNGNIIWDLTISPYLFDLSKGTTAGYGLRIETKKAPAITTDIEQSETSGQSSVRKVLIDNKVYIVTPDGKMYDVIGKGMKF